MNVCEDQDARWRFPEVDCRHAGQRGVDGVGLLVVWFVWVLGTDAAVLTGSVCGM